MSFEQERVYAEDLSETPSVLRYSDILKVGTPLADLQYNTMIPSNGSVYGPNQSIIRIPLPMDLVLMVKQELVLLLIVGEL